MKKRAVQFIILLALLWPGCARVPYDSDYPMTDEVVKSLNNDLQIRVPKGWFATTDESSAPNLLIWLVREDYGATMGVTEIHADVNTRRKLEREGLEALAGISFALKAERAKGKAEIVTKPKEFKLNGRHFCSYEYSTDGGKTLVRVVVFSTGRHFYDFAAIPAEKKGVKVDPRNLFIIQQSVLNSLRW